MTCSSRSRCGQMPSGAWIALAIVALAAVGIDPFGLQHLGHAFGEGLSWIAGGAIAVLRLFAGVWAYSDAERRGLPGWLVGLGVALVAWPLGLVVWLFVRNRYGAPSGDAAV